jgi:predicted transglutaminase-like protease
MKPKIKMLLMQALIIIGLYFTIDVVWVLLEIALHGEAQPSTEDSAIAGIFAYSIFCNLMKGVDFNIVEGKEHGKES